MPILALPESMDGNLWDLGLNQAPDFQPRFLLRGRGSFPDSGDSVGDLVGS
jgi:hypothetical protein